MVIKKDNEYMLQPEFFDLVAEDLTVGIRYNPRALGAILNV